ncbi:MAG: NAD(P)H-hydrate epimerase [Halobacteriales archaeon]|nr:NAD(P)H-hydrate epimerase [Halobacteriales archaeon]
MSRNSFRTSTGRSVTAVTADEMRDVDRIAVEEVGLQVLQMMENAGRILAWHVRDVRDGDVVVVAGNGGNGGGGLACARHLANRGIPVQVVLDRPAAELSGAAGNQYTILDKMGISISSGIDSLADIDGRDDHS